MLGYVLNLLAAFRGSRALMWMALAARLVLFAAVVVVLARSYGPAAGVVVLLAAVATRGLLVRKHLNPAR